MNHYKFHAFSPNKCRNTKVVILGLTLLILISGCTQNGVHSIPISNITPSSNVSLLSNETITNSNITNSGIKNDFANKDVRLIPLPVLNVTNKEMLSIINSTLNNTDKNIVRYISLISVLPKNELQSVCESKNKIKTNIIYSAGCTIAEFDNDGKLLDSKIYFIDFFGNTGTTFNNTLYHEIGHVVYWYNVGIYGDKDELFANVYAGNRSPIKWDGGFYTEEDGGIGIKAEPLYEKNIKGLLIEQNQTINEMWDKIIAKGIECNRLQGIYTDKYMVCIKEYNNMTKEFVFLVETNLKREYVGLFYNKT